MIGKQGIKIIVDPSALETENGSPIGKEIEIELKEITNQDELFRNDAPTVSAGKLLISGGAYYIGMASSGKKLRLKANKSLTIQFPKRSSKEMELFYGERDSSGILNWAAAGKRIFNEKIVTDFSKPSLVSQRKDSITKDTVLTIEKLLRYAGGRGNRLSTREFDSLANYKRGDEDNLEFSRKVVETVDTLTGQKTTEIQTKYYNPVEIRDLGWINLDRFYKNPNNSEIECEFDSSLKVQGVAIYVVFKNLNAMQKEYVSGVNNAARKLMNQYPVGEPVKLIAFTNIDGQFYASKQDLVLKSKETVKIRFSPVDDIETLKRSYKY